MSLTTGIHHDISLEEYHKSPGLSRSGMVGILKSPRHYLAKKDWDGQSSPEMNFGTASHLYVFEPEKFAKEYAEGPCNDRRTKEWKAAVKQNAGTTLMKPSEFQRLREIREQLLRHKEVEALLERGKPEVSMFWEHVSCPGVMLKSRPDWISFDNTLIDLKNTSDARPQFFGRHAIDLGYDIQAAMALDGFREITGELSNGFRFIVVEAEFPHGVKVYQPDPDMVTYGRMRYMEALRIYAEALDKDEWPGYEQALEWIDLPHWARKDLNDRLEHESGE